MLNFDQNDTDKYVFLEANIPQLDFLRDLLRLETLIQYAGILKDNNQDQVKAAQIFKINDAYRTMDDQLLDFIQIIKTMPIPQNGLNFRDTVVVSKNSCKLYKFLCTTTVTSFTTSTLPLDLKEKIDAHLSSIVTNLELAFLKEYTLDDVKNKVKELTKGKSKEDLAEVLNSNYLGKVGLA